MSTWLSHVVVVLEVVETEDKKNGVPRSLHQQQPLDFNRIHHLHCPPLQHRPEGSFVSIAVLHENHNKWRQSNQAEVFGGGQSVLLHLPTSQSFSPRLRCLLSLTYLDPQQLGIITTSG